MSSRARSASGRVLTSRSALDTNMADLFATAKLIGVSTRHMLVCAIMGILLLRCLVGLHPYSGAGTPPRFGDYEAQRHWMEITVNLPLSQWYVNSSDNDLDYWGLDYPPLSAFLAFAFGKVSQLVEPGLVELHASRGYETDSSKVLMRLSVLLMDLLLFIPGVWAFCRRFYRGRPAAAQLLAFVMICMQPAFILVDHGHFQYNCVALALVVWAVTFALDDRHIPCGVCFALALNFKQTLLYYAPAFFFYLLGQCLFQRRRPLLSILQLGAAVAAVFAISWGPFCVFNPTDPDPYSVTAAGCLDNLGQVLRRLFPFNRGLFEDKVANLWCTLNVVVKFRELYDTATLLRVSTILTGVLLLPTASTALRPPSTQSDLEARGKTFLLSLSCSAFAFFLCSFQVHEKAILLPLLPVALLVLKEYTALWVLGFVGVFSMFPLLQRDGLSLPYVILLASHLLLPLWSGVRSKTASRRWTASCTGRFIFFVPVALVGVLHLAAVFVPPPARLPDLYTVVISASSCAVYGLLYLYLTYRLLGPFYGGDKTAGSPHQAKAGHQD